MNEIVEMTIRGSLILIVLGFFAVLFWFVAGSISVVIGDGNCLLRVVIFAVLCFVFGILIVKKTCEWLT